LSAVSIAKVQIVAVVNLLFLKSWLDIKKSSVKFSGLMPQIQEDTCIDFVPGVQYCLFSAAFANTAKAERGGRIKQRCAGYETVRQRVRVRVAAKKR
jgi:hypothetical protein